MELSDQLVLWADELRAISSNGLHFVKSAYDETNYQRVRGIAVEILALVDGRPLPEVKKRLLEILDHYTPMVMGDALVINDAGEILLIQRADSGMWAAPGGAFDVGETAAEGAVRECHEETGWRVEPLALIGLYDSRRVETRVGHHVYHLSFLCRPLSLDRSVPSHAMESLNMGWFAEEELPPLDLGHRIWIPNAFRCWRGEMNGVYFDQ
jgi:8-oxo-dGTP pyrophosphatase MutT (NUDIX family)